jgi:hypothetical protein
MSTLLTQKLANIFRKHCGDPRNGQAWIRASLKFPA